MSAVLKDFRQTKTISLPGYENSSVEIFSGILYGDMMDVTALQKNADNPDAIARALVRLVKRWNFTDEKDQPVPVSEENIKILSVEAVTHLANECATYMAESKKN